MWSILSCVCWPSEFLLWRTVSSYSCPFFNWVLAFWVLRHVSSLCILDVNPLSDMSFMNIFSHTVGCLFVLLMVSFAVQKLFSLMQSHLFIFNFVPLAWGDASRKKLLIFIFKRFLPMFSSKSFIVSWLTFRSLIHFELLCMGLDNNPVSFSYMQLFSFPSTSCWRGCLFKWVWSL